MNYEITLLLVAAVNDTIIRTMMVLPLSQYSIQYWSNYAENIYYIRTKIDNREKENNSFCFIMKQLFLLL